MGREVASLGLGILGAVLFGPIGFAIGSLIGNLLFPQQVQGPRLTDLKLHTSSYGWMIPIVYGNMRVAGNVIDQTDLQEHEHHEGGKGGPEVTTFTYTATWAVYLCEGEIEGVRQYWEDGALIWKDDGSLGECPFTLYRGTEDQLPDPAFEAIHGVGNVSAYRGVAYAVFEDRELSRNSIPVQNFEIVQNSPPPNLHIVQRNDSIGHVQQGFSLISQWDLGEPTENIIVAGVTTGSTFSTSPGDANEFDPTTFAVIGAATSNPSYPMNWTGPTPQYFGFGVYVYANDSTTILMTQTTGTRITHASDVGPPIVTSSVYTTAPGFTVHDGAKFLYTAGVPDGLYPTSGCLSQDRKTLFIFTSTTNGGTCSHWYKIVDGIVVDDGTISPPLGLVGWGNAGQPHGVPGDSSIRQVISAENNGQYIWNYDGITNVLSLYTFDAAGNMADWGNGSLSVIFPLSGGATQGIEPSLKVIGTGYVGMAQGQSIIEVTRLGLRAQGVPLSDIVADISERCGLDISGSPVEVDVTELTDIVDGYIIDQQQAGRDSIVPLQSTYFFDGVESSGVVKFVKRGKASIESIPDSKLAARADGEEAPALVTVKRLQEVDLPAILNVKYVNAANDYQTGTQIAQRQVVESQLAKTIELKINMSDAKALQVAKALLFSSWVERMQHTFSTGPEYDYLEPTDVVTVHGYVLRITGKRNVANDVIEFDGVDAITGIWIQGPTAVAGSGFTQSTPPSKQATAFLLLDIPLIRDTDEPNGIYVPMAGAVDSTWKGGNLYKSSDGGTTYQLIASNGSSSIMGTTSDALGDWLGGNTFDEMNSVTVVIGAGGGALSSASALAVLNGANIALVGDELIQYKNATLITADTYTLSGLLRGRRGTEWTIPRHSVGDRFVLMDTSVMRAPLPFSELGQSRLYKAASFGSALSLANPTPFTSRGYAVRPYSPTQVGGGCDASGNVTINWHRRTRIGGTWADYIDVPLSEPTESYVVQIWNAAHSVVARIITVSSPTASYTAAQQVTDFGAAQQHIYCTVGQVGAYGLGEQTAAVIPGVGGSDGAPLSPVAPYGSAPEQPSSTCPDPVEADTLSFATGSNVQFAGFSSSVTWLVDFTTSAVDGTPRTIRIFEFGGPKAYYTGYLSKTPCGTPINGTQFFANPAPAIYLWNGTTPHSGKVRLDLSTKYYLSLTTDTSTSAEVSIT